MFKKKIIHLHHPTGPLLSDTSARKITLVFDFLDIKVKSKMKL